MVEIVETTITPWDEPRNLHIYTPDNWEDGERFPVFYMFDGHNLFYDEVASFGKSWGLREFCERTNLRVIIVGLECSHEGSQRLIEFSPYEYRGREGDREGWGGELMEWMSTELKDWVDENYPTLPDREHTLIGGSSMGGLMALYAVMAHNDVYGCCAALSPHHSFCMPALIHDMRRDIDENTGIYISWGSDESPTKQQLAKWTNNNIRIIRELAGRAVVFPHLWMGGTHSEACWENETRFWVKELGFEEFMK